MEDKTTQALAICLYVLLLGVYLLSYSGLFHNPDEATAFSVMQSVVKQGKFSIGQISPGIFGHPMGREGIDGEWYSPHGIGLPLLAVPLYWIALRLPHIGCAHLVFLFNAFITAGTGTLLFLQARRLRLSRAVSVAGALIFGFCTMGWVYSKYLFSDSLATFLLFLSSYYLFRWGTSHSLIEGLLSGGFLGLAIITRPINAILTPLFIGYLLWPLLPGARRGEGSPPFGEKGGGWKVISSAGAFISPLLGFSLLVLTYNYVRFGHILRFGYTGGFTSPLLAGLGAYLFSLDRSLFLYSPVLLAGVLGAPRFLKRYPREGWFSLLLIAIYPFLSAKWHVYWGGPVWGPRFLLPVGPFLVLLITPLLEDGIGRGVVWGFCLLCFLSMAVQVMGVAFERLFYLQLYGHRYPLLFAPLSLENLDLAWARVSGGGVRIEFPVLLSTLLLVALSGGATYLFARGRVSAGRMTPFLLGLLAFAFLIPLLFFSLRRYYVDERYGVRDDYQELMEFIEEVGQPGDVLLLNVSPYLDFARTSNYFLNYYKAYTPYYFLLREEAQGPGASLLEWLVSNYSRLWLMLERTPPADPDSIHERWLNEHAFLTDCSWFGSSVRLCLYSLPEAVSGEEVRYPLGANLDDKITLLGYTLNISPKTGDEESQIARSGDVIQVSLFWQARRRAEEDFTISLQVVDVDGLLRAQVDRSPVGGFSPTSSWRVGEVIDDRYGLSLPDGLPAGHYRLVVAIYDPQTMERLPVLDEAGSPVADHILLRTIEVRS